MLIVIGYECARAGYHYHQIDVHGVKPGSNFRYEKHIWVECKLNKVTRKTVSGLESKALDLHRSKIKEFEDWAPDILLVASLEGFTEDALDFSKERGIYCVHYEKGSYQFKGSRSREDFIKMKESTLKIS